MSLFRDQYPILHGRTYLANHSMGAVPKATAASLQKYYEEWSELGITAWDGPWWKAVEDFSALIEQVIHAPAGTVTPMENVTRGMAAVASCLDFGTKRNRVVMTDLEFTTSYPFWEGLRAQGAEIVLVKSDDGITVPADKLAAAIDERTLIVPAGHVYFRSGAIQDLRALSERAHQVGAYVLGDGYQAVGTVPVDVQALGVDFYVGGCHKWLSGGPGAGFLYVRKDLVTELKPRLTGWFGVRNPFAYEPTVSFEPAAGIHRFLGGTPNVPGLYAAREGIMLVLEAGSEKIRQISQEMTAEIIRRADEMELEVRTPRESRQRSGMVCIEFPHSKEASEYLCQNGVIVDWRVNCGIRVSPHFYNSKEDLSRFFEVLGSYLKSGGN